MKIETVYKDNQKHQTIEILKTGKVRLYAVDKKENGKSAEHTVNAANAAVTVISCSPEAWISSSNKMGLDMANAVGAPNHYIVKTPTTATAFANCWNEADHCVVVHTHGDPNNLCNEVEDPATSTKTYPVIITKNQIEDLSINNNILFVMVTACRTAGGLLRHDNVAYWLSKKIHPDGIVIANTDDVDGTDKEFWGRNKNQTWKAYKNGVILDVSLPVTLTMSSAHDIYYNQLLDLS